MYCIDVCVHVRSNYIFTRFNKYTVRMLYVCMYVCMYSIVCMYVCMYVQYCMYVCMYNEL